MSSTALAPVNQKALAACQGSFADVSHLNGALKWASENCILVSPAPSCANLPVGHEVAMAVVPIDTREVKDGGNVYPVGGDKYGLSKAPLNRIGRALGISWDPDLTCRLDDRRNPYYCKFRAVGTILDFDGRELQITGTKELDLSDESDAVKILQARKRDGGSIDKQLRELRYFIAEHCETKAKLRAIRDQGLDSGYLLDDLRNKPIIVARVLVTGRVPGNPALQEKLAMMQFAKSIGGAAAIFGAAQQIAQAPVAQGMPLELETAPAAPALNAPPAAPPFDFDAVGEPAPATAPAQQQSAATKQQQDQQQAAPSSRPRTGFKVPGGTDKGKDLADASTGSLEWWCKKIGKDLAEGKCDPQYEAYNEKLHKALLAEIAGRSETGQQEF